MIAKAIVQRWRRVRRAGTLGGQTGYVRAKRERGGSEVWRVCRRERATVMGRSWLSLRSLPRLFLRWPRPSQSATQRTEAAAKRGQSESGGECSPRDCSARTQPGAVHGRNGPAPETAQPERSGGVGGDDRRCSMESELSDPPEGMTIAKASCSNRTAVIVLPCDGPKASTGQKGNLIINAFQQRTETTKDGKARHFRSFLAPCPLYPSKLPGRSAAS